MKNDFSPSQALLEISRGYSVFEINENIYYFKHFSIESMLELEEYEQVEFKKAQKNGIKTSKKLLEEAYKIGSWTKEKEEKLKSLQWTIKHSYKALNKIEEVMAKEHEMLSLGGQAAAAAHSLGTPLSTIKIISQELSKQLRDNKDVIQDIDLLASQVERCNEILRKLTLNPVEEDNFIDKDLSIKEYLSEIISSFKEISKKNFIFNFDQYSNQKKISKSV